MYFELASEAGIHVILFEISRIYFNDGDENVK